MCRAPDPVNEPAVEWHARSIRTFSDRCTLSQCAIGLGPSRRYRDHLTGTVVRLWINHVPSVRFSVNVLFSFCGGSFGPLYSGFESAPTFTVAAPTGGLRSRYSSGVVYVYSSDL